MIFNQSVAQSVFPLQMVRSRMRRRRGVLQALQASRKRKASDAVFEHNKRVSVWISAHDSSTSVHYMKKEIAVKEKEKEIAVKEKEKEIAVLQKENQLLNRGLLQVQGLLTSRGFWNVLHSSPFMSKFTLTTWEENQLLRYFKASAKDWRSWTLVETAKRHDQAVCSTSNDKRSKSEGARCGVGWPIKGYPWSTLAWSRCQDGFSAQPMWTMCDKTAC